MDKVLIRFPFRSPWWDFLSFHNILPTSLATYTLVAHDIILFLKLHSNPPAFLFNSTRNSGPFGYHYAILVPSNAFTTKTSFNWLAKDRARF